MYDSPKQCIIQQQGVKVLKMRSKLLKTITQRDFSTDTIMKTGAILRGLTDCMKEEKAGQILTMLQESKTEQEFISKLEALTTPED